MLAAHHARLKELLDQGLTVVKAGELLAREGVVVPQRTLHRYALEVLGYGRASRQGTVPVADCEPGAECQADFGRMGLLDDRATGRRRVTHALILTAVYSRHMFVYLTFRQDLAAVIAGFDAAWAFFGGVFRVVIVDNMAPVVDRAHPLEARLNRAFAECAQDRGFAVDPARIRSPRDKPGVERAVQFVRGSFFAGESFPGGLAQAQRAAEAWCAGWAGQRIHRTTRRRPAEVFAAEEAPRLAPAPVFGYDLPVYATAKVHRDHHVEVTRALYSVPGNLIGAHVDVRADFRLVRIWHRSQLVKTPGSSPAGDPPTPLTCLSTRPRTRCATSATCKNWPATPGRQSAPTPPRCWATRCRGRRCARSMRCLAWPAGSARPALTPPARGRWKPRRSACR